VGVDAVLALTAAVDAGAALAQVLELLPAGALYVDLATSSAERKHELAELAAARGVDLVDVALMATVPGKGLATPQLAAGRGAARYQALLRGLGVPVVTVVGDAAGDAATRKLLRSVLVKGITAVVIEALRGGEAAGLGRWTYEHVVAELGAFDEPLVRRLVEGTGTHARRRRHEVEAAADLLGALGVEATMTTATAASLARVAELGVPTLPTPRGTP
jgi:3-hydroxyisobutyrate dehydrogenase-like beta-hydroxyacid dehydrogenase